MHATRQFYEQTVAAACDGIQPTDTKTEDLDRVAYGARSESPIAYGDLDLTSIETISFDERKNGRGQPGGLQECSDEGARKMTRKHSSTQYAVGGIAYDQVPEDRGACCLCDFIFDDCLRCGVWDEDVNAIQLWDMLMVLMLMYTAIVSS